MSDRPPSASRNSGLPSGGPGTWEPAPAAFLARQPYYPWLVIGTTCIGPVLGQLDSSIVQLALPTLEHEFASRLTAVTWVAIAYQLALASILPVYGRLAEIAGRKLMYLLGFSLFAACSSLCGLAANLAELVTFRVLLGLSVAMLSANSLVIMVKAAGPRRRGHALGVFSAAQAIGLSLGPIVGGVLLATLGWRFVFWITVPFTLAGVLIGWLVIPRTTDFDPNRGFDWRGAILLIPALLSLLLLVNKSYVWGPTSPAIIVSAITGVMLVATFIHQERRTPAPLLDLELFRIPGFRAGVVAIVASAAMLYSMFFLMSFVLVRGYHDTPVAAGLKLAIIPVALGTLAPLSGALHDRLGARAVLLGGMAACIAALILLSFALTGGESSLPGVLTALALYGAGLGLFIAPNNSLTLHAAPDRRSGEASGLVTLMRIFGTSLGIACSSAVLSWRLAILAGANDSTLGAPQAALLRSVSDGLVLPLAFAGIAAAAAMLRGPPGPEPALHASAVSKRHGAAEGGGSPRPPRRHGT